MHHDAPADLTACLLAWARRQPDAPALLAPGRAPLSFASLAHRIERVRAKLDGWGIARGDVVAWPIADRAKAAAALTILPAGATIAPLAARATLDALVSTLERLRPKALVLPEDPDAPAARAARALGLTELAAVDDGSGEAGAFDLVLVRRTASLDRPDRLASDWACIGATSGSTDKPKLVPHGHRQIVATARATGERLAIVPGDVSGNVSPLNLAGGIRNAFMQAIVNGAAVNVLPEMDAAAFAAEAAAGRITYTSASFAMFRELLARLERGVAFEPGRLRFVRIASGRLGADEMDRLEALLGVPVVTGLASSEAGTVAQQSLPPVPRIRGSVGPFVDCEIRLAGEDGRTVAAGAVGEIQVRGPQVFDGYVDDDALNARAFVDGWFRMGDLGRFDERGELHLVGRVKDVINRGGDKISPAEIDAVLLGLAGVADAAAFAIAHPRLGEEVVAAVVAKPGCTVDEESIRAQVRDRLGSRCTPRRVWFVDALPRNAAGKLRRMDLPAWVGHVAEAPAPRPATPAVPDPLAAALAGLWRSVFASPSVQVDDSFDGLGGSPQDAALLLGQVREVFGVELPPESLAGEAATVASMAQCIVRERARRTARET